MILIVIIALASFLASTLTLFSGFGLGTILTPIIAFFFPIHIAIAITGIVHFANNIFKLLLFYKNIEWNIAFKFGILSVIGALIGAWSLAYFAGMPILYQYTIFEKVFFVHSAKIVIGISILFFVFLELNPIFQKVQFKNSVLYLFGVLSGYFGGLSGNQGALRSAFLIKFNLSKESFIATNVAIACLVDLTRLTMYMAYLRTDLQAHTNLVIIACLFAYMGVLIGNRILKKVEMKTIKNLVTNMLILIALMLMIGLL